VADQVDGDNVLLGWIEANIRSRSDLKIVESVLDDDDVLLTVEAGDFSISRWAHYLHLRGRASEVEMAGFYWIERLRTFLRERRKSFI
jgi:hypothetical protein